MMRDDNLTFTGEFTAALELLHSGSSIFLTGRAGTGKSTLIRHFVENTHRRTVTVAPTGIAALNVDGYTIHRLFSFGPGVNEQFVRSPDYFPHRFRKTLANLDTLIIDEVSMVRADLFDALVAALERFGPQPGTPFGGVQLVLVGDLYQLPPVVTEAERAYIEDRFPTPYFFSADHFQKELFPTVELTTVFRQVGDQRLVALLNDVREGAMLEGARAELNIRTDADFEPDLNEFWLTLATTNRIVRARNEKMLKRLGCVPTEFAATVTGEPDGFEFPADVLLKLAPGAQVMLLNNESSGQWVNGSIGRIETIDQDRRGPVVRVRLTDGETVEVRQHVWQITRPEVRGGSLRHTVVGSFAQLPLKLAWAITIHKSQGQTLDNVVLDLTGGTFANGQLYVALSRCTSLSGLVLKRQVLPRDLKTDIRVRRFLNSASGRAEQLGRVYLSASVVGNEGDRYRPRPVEIAVVTSDGDELTTVVNPTMDLYSAETHFGITTRDVQLAPILTEAWAALSPLLEGRIPCGVNIDRTLGLIDAELKRMGSVHKMPLGVELPPSRFDEKGAEDLRSPYALTRARAMRDVFEDLIAREVIDLTDLGGSSFPEGAWGRGYLAARLGSYPEGRVGAENFTVGGNVSVEEDSASLLAAFLAAAWDRVVDRDPILVEQLRSAELHLGTPILPDGFSLQAVPTAAQVLTPGARVCFTGEVVSQRHGFFSRSQMEDLAISRGLCLSANMTKTKTDVLVVAARGTQSGKAKKAAQWDKPVISAEEFLDWSHGI